MDPFEQYLSAVRRLIGYRDSRLALITKEQEGAPVWQQGQTKALLQECQEDLNFLSSYYLSPWKTTGIRNPYPLKAEDDYTLYLRLLIARTPFWVLNLFSEIKGQISLKVEGEKSYILSFECKEDYQKAREIVMNGSQDEVILLE